MTCLITNIDDSWLWHRRFCHINFDNIVKVSTTLAVRDLPRIMKPTNMIFKECVMAKQKRSSFPSKKFTLVEKLEIVHTNLSGPTRTRGFYGERYFMILVDDFTKMMWIAFLKEKYEAFDKFKIIMNKVENESRMKIKCLRSDRGGVRRTILCFDDARFVNHSDTPNVATNYAQDPYGLDVALRDIAAGEELTMDYAGFEEQSGRKL